MPAYNSGNYISKTIDSILEQSFSDFELIIINDCSTDSTLEEIYSFKDDRILVINNDMNLGLYKSGNIGFKHSRGRYIARIDSDDIALPNRFSEQFNYLETNPDIGLVGSYYYEIDERDQICSNVIKFATDPIVIKWRLCFENPVPSPVMFRRNLFIEVGGYDEKSTIGMDYDLFAKMSNYSKISNISKVLMYWRVHPNAISSKYKDEQLIAGMNVSQKYITNTINKPLSNKDVFNLWHRDIQDYQKIKSVSTIMYKVCQSILNQDIWNKDEKKILRENVSRKLITYIRPHIKKIGAIIFLLKLFLLSPFSGLSRLLRIGIRKN